jgi:Zinc binding domain
MSDCCSTDKHTLSPKKSKCPVNGMEYIAVSAQTISHHIKSSWKWEEKKQGYYFCDDPACDVVYFGEDGSVVSKQALRQPVGIKEASPESLICYCFGVTKSAAAAEPNVRDYVIQQTKTGMCSCETSNPSGRCCLKDFPRQSNLNAIY